MRFDIEAVRVRLEREVAPPTPLPGHDSLESKRREAQRCGLRLTENLAPRLHAAMRAALERLGVEREYELYSGQGNGANACLLWSDPILVQLIDGLGNVETPTELEAVFAHEIGHALAGHRTQRGHDVHRLATELTADRVGLLGCGSLEAAVRMEMRMAAHGVTLVEEAQHEYLIAAYSVVAQRFAEGAGQLGSHPEHSVRAWALAEFAKTATYRSLVGEQGGTSLADLEDMIDTLLRPKRREPNVHATLGSVNVKPTRQPPPVSTSLEGAAFDVLVDAAGRNLRAGQAGAKALLGALGPPFQRLGASAMKRIRGKS